MAKFIRPEGDDGSPRLCCDHAAAATKIDLDLRPTELLVFGAARAGTPLMQISQVVGLDLPLKALVWQDEDGKTWLSYADPKELATGLSSERAAEITKAMNSMLAMVAKWATEP